ncbi:MAG: MG2 domain-containing protein, partial [Thermoanaerobaculia bacterium]
MKQLMAALCLVGFVSAANAAPTLRIVSAGPNGEIATRAEASEIRVVFSEPMVALGKIPATVAAPFFRIEPAVKGTFRWSGTTTLIFTPDPKNPLPFATAFAVTIDQSATSLAGNTLERSHRFTFTTPTVQLMYPEWYRKGGKAGGAVVIALRFNQPVDAATILPHVKLRTQGHPVEIPLLTDAARERLARTDPAAIAAFEAKVAKTEAAAKSDADTVLAFAASDWDKKRFPSVPELVVLETKPGVPSDTWIRLTLDAKLARSTARAQGEPQEYTIELEPTLFASNPYCTAGCDPDWRTAVSFRTFAGIPFDSVRKSITVTDITNPAAEKVLESSAPKRDYEYPSSDYSLDELGYSIEPAHRYAIRAAPSLTAVDGQTLGYAWTTIVEYGNRSAFVSLSSGHGVWESDGGSILPFHARNYRSIKQWLAPLTLESLLPAMQKLKTSPAEVPPTQPQTRAVSLTPNKTHALGLDLKPALGGDNQGIVWAAVQPSGPFKGARENRPGVQSTIVQSTNLGISVKDSPVNAIVRVTRLDTGAPVPAAKVSIRGRDNQIAWTGTTDERGLAIVPRADFRRDKGPNPPDRWSISWRSLSDLNFIATAEKDGDVAYVGSDWNEGINPWTFGVSYDLAEADPLLRGTIFTDRGVYKLGEEIHFKLIARSDAAQGMRLLPSGTEIQVTLTDSQSNEVEKRTVKLSDWSSAEWTFRLPDDAPLGDYAVTATTGPNAEPIRANVLVAAYRRPDFRVDATLTSASTLAGTKLDARITGKYLFGGAMSGAPVRWAYSKRGLYTVPSAITDRWPSDRHVFLGWDESDERGEEVINKAEAKLSAAGELALSLETEKAAGRPYEYRVEGVVTDVTRQQIAGRASFRVDAAPWYVGVKRPDYFADAKKGVDTDVVVAGLDGLAVAGVPVKVELKRIQWTSVRQAEGDGFYQWDSERKEIAAGEWTITSAATAVPLHLPLAEGGEYLITARAEDAEGRSTTTHVWFYAMGGGYTAWQRYDHNRIDLVPEKATWKPGETARILVKSPWESATALLTTEREGVRTWKSFDLTSTQQTITVPITEADIPNVFISVLLIKGRTSKDPGRDGSDPGKPSFRLGYVELMVEDASKRLQVAVKANADDYRPASKATIDVDVRDVRGNPSQAEVTLWAVDYGVLSLTSYRTPDVLGSVWLRKALQVATIDSRTRIVSRRVLTPKGGGEGGGGGVDAGPGMLRKDFRVLAFWVGSLVTDANGKARTQITLPESLTTYRIMAVAADRASRFGWAEDEIRINQPLMITAAWPRFLAAGDKAFFGGVVHNQSKKGGRASVTIRSLDPSVLAFEQEKAEVEVAAGRASEVRFSAVAKMAGEARVQMRVKMGRETDAFEDVIPVRVLVTPETVAAYGTAKPRAEESLRIPENVVPGYGGLKVDLASTAMVGLGEGARYLVEYPHGCAEQRASAALALLLASELGHAFPLPGIDPSKTRVEAQAALDDLRRFQCADGAFAFWSGRCTTGSPYLTSWVLHVLLRGKALGFRVDQGLIDRGADALTRELQAPPQQNAAWM